MSRWRAAPQTEPKGDAERIQGSWRVTAAEELLENLEWVITDDEITCEFGDKVTEWFYKLDPSEKPK